jgi:hypothetical protein
VLRSPVGIVWRELCTTAAPFPVFLAPA